MPGECLPVYDFIETEDCSQRNQLKDSIDERHDGRPLGQDDHRAKKNQEGDQQGNNDVSRCLGIAPEVLQCFKQWIQNSM